MRQFYLDIAPMAPGTAMFDTQDLSTIRGSSATLLWAPEQVQRWLQQRLAEGTVKTVFTGASEGLFEIRATVDPDELVNALHDWLRGHALYKHFAFVIVTTPVEKNFLTCRARLDAKRRFLRHQELTLVLPDGPSPRDVGYCSVDRTRPANKELLPKHRNEAHDEPPWVSPSVLARHQEGRKKRQDYYEKIARDGGEQEDEQVVGDLLRNRAFSDECAEIVGTPPDEVSPTLENKLAVIQMDGNSFGKIRETVIAQLEDAVGGLEYYSIEIKKKRARLVRRLLEWASQSAFEDGTPRPDRYMIFERNEASRRDGPPERFRFETLLWGGDEMFWVLPAWAAFDFMSEVQDEVKDWSLEADLPLTHSAGMVLCSSKTPIRQAKALAEELSEGANAGNDGKDLADKCSGVQIQVLESVDIPDRYLKQYRAKLFGIDGNDGFRQQPFTFPGGAGWQDVVSTLRKLDGCLPRSQVYRLLRKAKAEGALTDQGSDAAAAIHGEAVKLLSRSKLHENELFHRALGYDLEGSGGEALAFRLMPLVHLVTLWDYVDPFGRAVEATDV